ncbi:MULTISPECIES: hypothetical protein [Metabacillus]|uniref:Uncharacterized protein n=2 Tax=Metabacillus TaxID=2675233 RepID=A0A179SXZ6_9BACI|nr:MULTISPECIES: hypothetical protein [Metabacillus]OAS85163.1 hypothetical protein A6K24_06545 [Metabacillus litoralis]QNF26171.1 hypothetical protein HUW50_00565 [Metabacillus sp. KUDC1714]
MYRKQIKIGEHLIFISSHSSTVMKMFNRNFFLIDDNINDKPDFSIHIIEGYGISFVDYHVSILKTSGAISYKRADYLIEVDLEYKKSTISIHNDLALKHALMNLYSSFLVHNNWGILLHSSCVLENSGAHIFSGQSGAGKSTVAKLSYPRELLSDEATIIKITPEEVKVFDSPFRSELEGKCHSETHTLKSIQLLHQSVNNERTKLSKSTGLLQLMDKVFYWTNSPDETKRIFHLLNKLVNQVPVYDLHFQKNNSFWEMIS